MAGLVVTTTYDQVIHLDNCEAVQRRPYDVVAVEAPETLAEVADLFDNEDMDAYAVYLTMCPHAQNIYWKERSR